LIAKHIARHALRQWRLWLTRHAGAKGSRVQPLRTVCATAGSRPPSGLPLQPVTVPRTQNTQHKCIAGSNICAAASGGPRRCSYHSCTKHPSAPGASHSANVKQRMPRTCTHAFAESTGCSTRRVSRAFALRDLRDQPAGLHSLHRLVCNTYKGSCEYTRKQIHCTKNLATVRTLSEPRFLVSWSLMGCSRHAFVRA
jgi:hypothetical protein